MRSCLKTFRLLSILERKNIPRQPAIRDTADAVIAIILNCNSCGAVNVEVIPGNPSSWLTVVVLSCRRESTLFSSKDDPFNAFKFGGNPSVIILSWRVCFIRHTSDHLFVVFFFLVTLTAFYRHTHTHTHLLLNTVEKGM